MSSVELIATAAFGLEAVVARELEQMGYRNVRLADSRVTFTADEAAICRTNYWLRSADRVLVQIGQFRAEDFGVLFDQVHELPWEDWIPPDGAFPVTGRSRNSKLHSVPAGQSIVKKSIAERLKKKYSRHWFQEDGAEFAVEFSIDNDLVTIALNTTGAGLHKRGYRTKAGAAPLKETLAAALVQLSVWTRERPLADPFCGSGTIAIEAALIARNRAPGAQRTFASQGWPRIGAKLWKEATEEARQSGGPGPAVRIQASDCDKNVIQLAESAARLAKVDRDIDFKVLDMERFRSPYDYGCMITNPPYGERMGVETDIRYLYEELLERMRELQTWSAFIMTPSRDVERIMGREATRRRKLYNGKIACQYYQFLGPRPPYLDDETDSESLPNAGDQPSGE